MAVEYVPLGKVNSVHQDATAFVRRGKPAVFNVIRWKEDTKEKEQAARELSHELLGNITKGNVDEGDEINIGYGNYGKLIYCRDFFFFLQTAHGLPRRCRGMPSRGR